MIDIRGEIAAQSLIRSRWILLIEAEGLASLALVCQATGETMVDLSFAPGKGWSCDEFSSDSLVWLLDRVRLAHKVDYPDIPYKLVHIINFSQEL